MKKIIGFVFVLFIFSCKSQTLQYHFKKGNAEATLKRYISLYTEKGEDVFLIFSKNEQFKIIDIIPTKELDNKKIYDMYIKNSNRKLHIENDSYYVLFDYDYELSAIKTEIFENNQVFLSYKQNHYLYDKSTTLYFDKDWNFIESKSLINYQQ